MPPFEQRGRAAAGRCIPHGDALSREGRGAVKALLQDEDTKLEAANILRGLVDKVVVSPAEGGFALDLHGDLAGILALASNAKQPSGRGAGGLQVSLVAGAGFEPAAFRL